MGASSASSVSSSTSATSGRGAAGSVTTAIYAPPTLASAAHTATACTATRAGSGHHCFAYLMQGMSSRPALPTYSRPSLSGTALSFKDKAASEGVQDTVEADKGAVQQAV